MQPSAAAVTVIHQDAATSSVSQPVAPVCASAGSQTTSTATTSTATQTDASQGSLAGQSSDTLKLDLSLLQRKYDKAIADKVDGEERLAKAEAENLELLELANFYKSRAETAMAAYEELRHKVETMRASHRRSSSSLPSPLEQAALAPAPSAPASVMCTPGDAGTSGQHKAELGSLSAGDPASGGSGSSSTAESSRQEWVRVLPPLPPDHALTPTKAMAVLPAGAAAVTTQCGTQST